MNEYELRQRVNAATGPLRHGLTNIAKAMGRDLPAHWDEAAVIDLMADVHGLVQEHADVLRSCGQRDGSVGLAARHLAKERDHYKAEAERALRLWHGEVINRPAIPFRERLILLGLMTEATATQWATGAALSVTVAMGGDSVARLMGLSRSQTRRHLQRLRDRGLLSWKGRGPGRTEWRVDLVALLAVPAIVGAEAAR